MREEIILRSFDVSLFEEKLIKYIRDLEFGKVEITIVSGKPKSAIEITGTERWDRFDK